MPVLCRHQNFGSMLEVWEFRGYTTCTEILGPSQGYLPCWLATMGEIGQRLLLLLSVQNTYNRCMCLCPAVFWGIILCLFRCVTPLEDLLPLTKLASQHNLLLVSSLDMLLRCAVQTSAQTFACWPILLVYYVLWTGFFVNQVGHGQLALLLTWSVCLCSLIRQIFQGTTLMLQ